MTELGTERNARRRYRHKRNGQAATLLSVVDLAVSLFSAASRAFLRPGAYAIFHWEDDALGLSGRMARPAAQPVQRWSGRNSAFDVPSRPLAPGQAE